MAAERDLELLDDYLANRLDEQGRRAFEQQLNSDPGLKTEYELQQQLVSGIQKARVAELKAMLGNVAVPAPPKGAAIGTKIALFTAVIGVVGTGIYLYLNQDQQKEDLTETPAKQQENTTPVTPQAQPESKTQKPAENPAQVTEEEPYSEEPVTTEHTPAQAPKAVKKPKAGADSATKEPSIEVYDPTEEAVEGDRTQQQNEEAGKEANRTSIAVEIDASNKKYNFHYNFKDGKLFLYGPFEKNLYEIMEFFTDDKRTIFLFYKDQYFLLREEHTKPKPLTAITDPALLKKLREYRN